LTAFIRTPDYAIFQFIDEVGKYLFNIIIVSKHLL
jgi:hypothetical protein